MYLNCFVDILEGALFAFSEKMACNYSIVSSLHIHFCDSFLNMYFIIHLNFEMLLYTKVIPKI